MPGEEVIQGERIPEPANLSLVDGPFQLVEWDHGGKVEQRSGHGGDGDAVVDSDLIVR